VCQRRSYGKVKKKKWEGKKERKKGERKGERERERRERKFRAKIQRDATPLQILLVCPSINKVRGEWG